MTSAIRSRWASPSARPRSPGVARRTGWARPSVQHNRAAPWRQHVSSCAMRAIVGVDVGGTFTDVALIAGGRLITAKVPTTAERPVARGRGGGRARARARRGSSAARRRPLRPRDDGRHERAPRAARRAHGPRRHRAASATCWRSPARPGRTSTGSSVAPPAPLAEVTAEVDERIGPRRRPPPARPRHRSTRPRGGCGGRGVEAVAVCLLHSYAHPRHEREVGAPAAARRCRASTWSRRIDVAPEFREYERASTTVADAYLGPVAGGYLRRLGRSAAERGLPAPDVMQSSGGVCALAEAAAHPVRLLLSGPAGGVAAVVGRSAPARRVSFDMGGTSTDVCLIRDGEAGRSPHRIVAGLPVRAAARRHPHRRRGRRQSSPGSTRAARCGSGRRARGPIPGRPATAAAARLPTVTDANLVLGRLEPGSPLAGGAAPRRAGRPDGAGERRRPRSGRCARPPRASSRSRTQRWCARSASSASSRGTTRASSSWSRSAAPGRCTPARSPTCWGCGAVVVPAAGGVLSALGIAVGDRRRTPSRASMQPLRRLAAGAARSARGEAECELRYRGQAHELTVPVAPRATPRRAVPCPPPRAVRVRRSRRRDRGRRACASSTRGGRRRSSSFAARCRVPAPCAARRRCRSTARRCGSAEGWTARRRPDGAWRTDAMIDPAALQVLAAALRGRRRGDGRGARPLRPLGQHQGAARLLDGASSTPAGG